MSATGDQTATERCETRQAKERSPRVTAGGGSQGDRESAGAKSHSGHPAQKAYFIGSVVVGAGAVVFSSLHLFHHPADFRWLILAGLCLLTSSCSIRVRGINAKISISDSFYFASILLFGPSTGVLTAALEGFYSSMQTRTKHRVRFALFSMSSRAWSALAGAWILVYAIGQDQLLRGPEVSYKEIIEAVVILASAQYILGSGAAATLVALETGKSLPAIWKDRFLWTSLNCLAGAGAAGLAAMTARKLGPDVVGMIAAIVILVFYTYRIYLGKVLRLNQLYLNTVEALAMAIDAKDQVTHGHVRRVQIFARGLGKAMGMCDEESLRWMEAAALLHDIGKLAIPEYILNKPGKLSRSEFIKMTMHPIVGSDILSSIRFPYDVARDVRHHHENWDGSGYPDGLKGTAIPLGARILAVVDAYDALTSERPYQSAMGQGEAMTVIRGRAGTHFDPEIVWRFEEILDRLLEEVHLQGLHQPPVQGSPILENTRRIPSEIPAEGSKSHHVFQDIVSTHREVSALYDLAQTLGSTLNLQETLPIIASKIAKLIPSTTCVVYLFSPDRSILTAEHVSGANVEAFKNHSMECGKNLSGWVAANNQPAVNADPECDLLPLRPLLTVDLKKALVYPLYCGTVCLGTISLYGAEDVNFIDDHIRIMETVAKQAARAIHNAMQYEETQIDALTDRLTSLPNARYLDLYFESEMEKARRFKFPLVVMAMDLDRFKEVNDSFGHHVGDMILLEVAKVLNRNVRASDIVIRYGGDEFIAIISRATREEAMVLAKRIDHEVDSINLEFRPGEFAKVGISIGLASYPDDGELFGTLLEKADSAMYHNKKSRMPSLPDSRRALGRMEPIKDKRAG